MGRALTIRDTTKPRFTMDTPMLPEMAAGFAFPDGRYTAADIRRAIADAAIGYERLGRRVFVTMRDIVAWRRSLPGFQRAVSGIVGTIYVLGFGPYVKIGYTQGLLEARVAALQTGAPERLVVYASFFGTVEQEHALRDRFAGVRLEGDWCRKDGPVPAWIEEGCPL